VFARRFINMPSRLVFQLIWIAEFSLIGCFS
jgi:hypothetical protein